jgi:hypothetical protein
VVEVGRRRGGGKAGEVGSELRMSKEDKVREGVTRRTRAVGGEEVGRARACR